MKYILITTTFNKKEEAEKIIEILLKERLVSCVQMSMIKSSYHWKGNIEVDDEYFLQMKTKKELYKKVEETILKNHSYEVPQIIYYDINGGYEPYLDWINEETSKGEFYV